MFTGIIEDVGQVLSVESFGESLKLHVSLSFEHLELGESIAVDGVCLTVAKIFEGKVLFFISPETIKRSHFGRLRSGSRVNLERALTLKKGLSGHFLQAHTDGKARLLRIEENSECYSLYFEVPSLLSRYCVEKGFVGLNGISLTIHSILDQPQNLSENEDLFLKADETSRQNYDFRTGSQTEIGVTIIPHTWAHTNLSHLKIGDEVNLEVDILAKYVERLCCRH